jgi:hypothetical protein
LADPAILNKEMHMIRDPRVKVAGAIMVAVLALLGRAQAQARSPSAVRYACHPRQSLIVERSSSRAVVQFIDRTYELRRAPSRLGEKYLSAKAALIIDGASAVFVAEDRLQLGTCVEAIPMASYHRG